MRRIYQNSLQAMSKSKRNKFNSPSLISKSEKIEEPIRLDKDGNIRVRILAKPGAKQNCITDISIDGVGIQIAAPPSEGEANAELVKYLSKVLRLRKSDVVLDKGARSRNKVVLINKDLITTDIVKELIQREIGL
uniref:Uncharacterized protein n=1 Tax=Glossina pallidipes TaxID=7398 RepID=A0A1A9Z362_GLOPL